MQCSLVEHSLKQLMMCISLGCMLVLVQTTDIADRLTADILHLKLLLNYYHMTVRAWLKLENPDCTASTEV